MFLPSIWGKEWIVSLSSNKHSIALAVLLVLAATAITGCEGCARTSKPVPTRRTNEVAAEVRRFDEAMVSLESIAADAAKHDRRYGIAVSKRRSILDDREALEAAKAAYKHACRLEKLALRSLEDERVVRSVAGSGNEYGDYLQYARRLKRKHASIAGCE